MRDPFLAVYVMHRLAMPPPIESTKRLARELQAHVRSVRRVLRRLERAGLVSRDRAHGPWRIAPRNMPGEKRDATYDESPPLAGPSGGSRPMPQSPGMPLRDSVGRQVLP